MNDEQRTRESYYRQLQRKMILTVIVVSFTPMILVIGILLYQFNIVYHEKTEAHLQELVQKHKQNIDTFLKERMSNLRSLIGNYDYSSLADTDFLTRELQTLRGAYSEVFVDLGVIDESGRQVAYAGPYNLEN